MKALSLWIESPVTRKIAARTLLVLGVTWLVFRFVGLEASPPGFFIDEARPAVHAMCLAETGRDAEGKPWPLYSTATGGGNHTLALLFFDVVWMKVFGKSIAAFRAGAAFWILVTAFGLFFLTRDLAAMVPETAGESSDEESARSSRKVLPWMVLLAALLSPWSFQFSRVAWDLPVAPAYMILSLVGLVRCHRGDKFSIVWALFAGICASLAMTAYAPLRAVVPLVLALVGGLLLTVTRTWSVRWTFIKGLLAAAVAATIAFWPTLRMLADGKVNDRMNNVAIWRPDWVSAHKGELPRWEFLVKNFLDNLALHLRPSFLFMSGDESLRHSSQIEGHLSPLDMLALALVGGMVLLLLLRLMRAKTPLLEVSGPTLPATTRSLVVIAFAAVLCGFFGLVPAALTFEAIPHAGRAIGAWPFVPVFSGTVLAIAWGRRRWVAPLLAIVALGHTIYFLPLYFHAYDNAAKHWFMREMPDEIRKERLENPTVTIQQIISDHFGYSYYYDEVPRYYLMSEAKMGCEEAKSLVQGWRAAGK